MPNHPLHEFVARILLGKPFCEVNRVLDYPVRYLGARHRVLFHKPLEAYVIGSRVSPGSSDGSLAGLLHVWLDMTCSNNKELEKALERLMLSERKR